MSINLKLTPLILNTFIVCSVWSQNLHIVKPGDTLSQIIENEFPNEKIYGKFGKLNEVLAKNHQIKNPDKIKPHDLIRLRDTPSPSSPIDRRMASSPIKDKWRISSAYGARYVSLSQTGALGKGDVGALFLNAKNLNLELIYENWMAWLYFDSYKFKYSSSNSQGEETINALDIGASYGWFMASIGIEQNPLFKNNESGLKMSVQSLNYVALGAQRDWELPASKLTRLSMKTWWKYVYAGPTDNSNIKVDSLQGYGLRGQLELQRQIIKKKNYALHATWLTDLGYQKTSQVVEWGATEGKVELDIVKVSTSLGLVLEF